MSSLWPTDIRRILSAEGGLGRKKADEIYSLIFDPQDGVIASAIASGQNVHLTGLGKFEKRERKGRQMTLARGDTVDVPPRYYPSFKTSEAWKRRVRED